MSHGAGPLPSSASDQRLWWISVASATCSLLCAFTALCLVADGPVKVVDALYSSAHLLLLHMPQKDVEEFQNNNAAWLLLYAARFLAILAVGSTSVALIVRTLGREIKLRRTVRKGAHAVICGLGPIGSELVNQMIADKHEVVVIDRGEDAALVNGALESGASVIIGDPADPRFLRQAGASSAKFLFAAASDDAMNISAGTQAIALVPDAAPGGATPSLHIYIHVADPQFRAELHKRRLLPDSHAHLHAGMFSVFDNSARLLLRDHPLDHTHIASDDPRHVQLILVGFGIMGESVLVRAALGGHYANLLRLKAVVIDPDAKRAERVFRARYPQFAAVADATFLNLDPAEPATQSTIAALCENTTENISTIVIPLEQSTASLTVSLSLAGRLHCSIPIRFRLDKDAGIGELIQRHHHGAITPCPMTPFGNIADACRSEHWANKDLDIKARALHEDYVARLPETAKEYPANPSAAPWELLSEQLRESNRQAADHIPVKLRAVGFHAARKDSGDLGELVSAFAADQVELLARMEHRRWMAERFLAGWVPGPKDHHKRVSPWLIEWEELPAEIAEYDRNAVRIIPRVLDRVGMEVRR